MVDKLKENLENMKIASYGLVEKGETSIDKISSGVKVAIERNTELKQIRDREAPRDNEL